MRNLPALRSDIVTPCVLSRRDGRARTCGAPPGARSVLCGVLKVLAHRVHPRRVVPAPATRRLRGFDSLSLCPATSAYQATPQKVTSEGRPLGVSRPILAARKPLTCDDDQYCEPRHTTPRSGVSRRGGVAASARPAGIPIATVQRRRYGDGDGDGCNHAAPLRHGDDSGGWRARL